MALSATGIAAGQRMRASQLSQFYDLLTGVMTDQPVTLKNTLTLGDNQAVGAHLLTLKGVSGQTGDILRVMLYGAATPIFKINSSGLPTFDQTISLGEIATPSAPASGAVIYSKAGGGLYTRPVGGSEEQVATLTGTQILSGKTLTAPQINDTSSNHQYVVVPSELSADRNVTLPLLTGADEFVFKSHAVTLANKTLTAPTIADLTNMQHAHAAAGSGGAVDHVSLSNKGTNTHAQIDTHVGGEPFTAHANNPNAHVHHSANQTIANDTETYLAFNGEELDNDAIHDLVTNNSRLTCKTAGVYLVIAKVRWAPNAVGLRNVTLAVNRGGGWWSAQCAPSTSEETQQSVTGLISLAVNDYVECRVRQTSTGNLDVVDYSSFAMVRVA